MKLMIQYIFKIVIIMGIGISLNAQTVDDIIGKHLKAHGDIEKWEEIESMKISGRFTAFSVEDDFFAIKTKDGKYYSELELGKYSVEESFDGKKGWTIDPWQEISFPRELNKSEQNVFLQKAEFFTPFYKYKEKGCKVELVGEQKVDGINVFVIKLTRPTGGIETWYLDANTYLAYKYDSRWVDFGYGVPAETYFDDYREINGIVIPYFIERTFWQRDRVLQIENIDFNINIDDEIFEMPISNEIQKLAFLEGDWGVKVEAYSRRANRWYKSDTTSSSFEFIATNLIQESISYLEHFVETNINTYGYSSSDSRYFSSIYGGFSSNMEGREEDGAVISSESL